MRFFDCGLFKSSNGVWRLYFNRIFLMSMNQLLLLHVLALTLNCLYASLFSTVSLDERQIPPNLVSAFLCIIASIYTYIYWQNTRKYVDHGSWRTLRERKQLGWGYTHDGRADNYPYRHDRRADSHCQTAAWCNSSEKLPMFLSFYHGG